MTLKLKLKVNPSGSPKNDSHDPEHKPLPRIKIKPLIKSESGDGVTKPKPKKEKLKKLKLSLGKAALTPSESSPSTAAAQPIFKKVPKVRIKPTRIPGEGYDSEAPEVEDDPLIEQGIVVRFANDANLDFIHNASSTGDFSNVNIKWITRDKAVVNVNLTLYSARLIDLPTLTELYKTVDKKNIFKTIDISQILLVLHPINPKQLNMEQDFEVPEEYTYVHPLYKLSVNKEIRNSKTVYRHGLAYAYEDVYRRFRPRKTNPRVMGDIELRVDELVRRDQEAQESHYEYVDSKAPVHKFGTQSRSNTPSGSMPTTPRPRMDGGDKMDLGREEEDDEDEQQMALDLEADIDNVLEQELAEALDSTSNNTAATVLMKSEFDNEDGGSDIEEATEHAEDDDDDDDDDDEEEEEEDDDDEDEVTKQDKSRVKKLEEEIADLERAADKQKVLLATASFKMMRMKFQSAYNNLKGQLDQKKRELSKIREQQQKQMAPAPIEKNNDEEEEDDEEDEDDDEEMENDDDHDEDRPQEQEEQQNIDAGPGPAEAAEDAADDEQSNDDDDNDDIDDFQGLF